MGIEKEKTEILIQQRSDFFNREDVAHCNADELRRKLRESKLFPPIEETRVMFPKQFLDGRETDQKVGGGTGTSKTHQIISQIIARGVNLGSPFVTLLITGKREQALNSF